MSKFQIAVISVFSLFIMIGIVMFATSKGTTGADASNISVWGMVDDEVFNAAYKNSTASKNKNINVTYRKVDPADFQQIFIGALADGAGPDVVLLRDDAVYENRNKLLAIPYKNFTEREFKDTFIEEGELFLNSSGVLGVPFMIDPLVMYWNRDIFSNNIVSQPPKYWDEIYPLITKMTRKDGNANILQSTIALGEWKNIINAKDILSLILIQAGTPISARNGDKAYSVLSSTLNFSVSPGQSAVNFYTQFSNPTSINYSWNRSLPSSLNMFLSGNLAMYFGFASEIFGIQQKNSNLNFDVTYVPQIRSSTKKVGYGKMYVLSLVKQSKQILAGYTVIRALTEPASIKAVEDVTSLPPVRRDLLADKPVDAYKTVFYDSALISKSWVDPNSISSSASFGNMIQSITGGKSRVAEAINLANEELNSQY